MSRHRLHLPAVFIAVSLCVLGVSTARAGELSHARIVRLSWVEGEVQYQRGTGDWEDATANLPIQEGFSLATGAGYAEVEFEDGVRMWLAQNSSVTFGELALDGEMRISQMQVTTGTVIVSVPSTKHDNVSLSHDGLQLTVPRSGRFRVDVAGTGSWVTVLKGKIDANTGAGVQSISSEQTLHFDSANPSGTAVDRSPATDDFGRWVEAREQALNRAQAGTTRLLNVKGYSAGLADLTTYGTWYNMSFGGSCWAPAVFGEWSPYIAGHWTWFQRTGWTWVSDEPWGWIPYHFGAWAETTSGWCWT
ncbi:MAG: DUF6600 domain-containing protein, partial [Bryobacteraceae bacterium]